MAGQVQDRHTMDGEIWEQESWREYERDAAVIYVVDSKLRIKYCNAAWDKFASENGGERLMRESQIGCDLAEILPPPLRPYYLSLYGRVLDDGQAAHLLYECSSATTFREFHMRVMRGGTVRDGLFLVVVHSLVLETERDQGAGYKLEALRDANGLITMCCQCRRARINEAAKHHAARPGDTEKWVWVPALVQSMPREVSHGLCRVCFDVYYGS
jgi:hypothetical protein